VTNSDTTREGRTLILAPTGRDSSLMRELLGKAGISALVCSDSKQLCHEAETDAGCLLLAEEAIGSDACDDLVGLIGGQPSWSDLPLVILTRLGADSATVGEALTSLGNVTLLERPIRVAALVSVVRAALRSRERQYQIRAHLLERERSADEMRTLLDTLPVGVYIAHDPACKRITGNRSGYHLLRMPPASNLSRTAPPEEQPTHFQPCRDGAPIPSESLPMQRAARGEPVREEEVDLVFDDGTVLNAIVSASPLFDAGGNPRGAVAAMTDITARKRIEAALRDADRRKDEFLATLAHELRNPLAPIRNSLHVLRLAGSVNPAVEHVRAMMERQVDHMVRLVDDLMEVSRITRGKITLRTERVDLVAVIKSAIETSQPLIDGADQLLLSAFPEEPLIVEGDPVRLAQVFANLLNNAAKYEAGPGQIHVTARREGSGAVVSIRDTGIGISAEMLPRVFDMFTQIDGSDRRTQGGLGIGLTLARSIIQMHGGSIMAKSAGLGLGSEFIVRLPVADGARASVAPLAATPWARVPLRVMVVDDNRDAADSLGMLLEFLGAEVRVVHDGAAALEAWAAFHPSLVLMDLGMPGLDGYEVARRIRERSTNGDVTLIALTGWGQEQDRRRSRDAGFDDHLIKPAEIDTLQALLVSVADREKQRRTRG
jgi:signal transduction histidine kinase/DNA-binding response OmpR family regulator